MFFWIREPQDAGAYVGRWEWLGFSLAGLRLAKGPVDFANASLRPFSSACDTTRLDGARSEEVVPAFQNCRRLDQPSVVIRQMQRKKGGHPPSCGNVGI